MSNEPVVSMRELELESAELLPSRETLWCYKGGSSHTTSYSSSYTSQSYNGDGSFIPILNGSNFLNNVNVLVL